MIAVTMEVARVSSRVSSVRSGRLDSARSATVEGRELMCGRGILTKENAHGMQMRKRARIVTRIFL